MADGAGEGVDGILHFGGYSVEGSWDAILQANIIGGYNLFEAARKQGPLPTADALEEIAGMGLIARHDGHDIAVGSHRLFDHLKVDFNAEAKDGIARLHGLGHTVVIVARGGEVVGLLGLADMPRASAKPMIDRLHALGVHRVVMLTGDQRPAAEAIAAAVDPS